MLNQTAAQGNLSAFVNPEDVEFAYPDTGNNWAEARCGVRPHHPAPKRSRVFSSEQPFPHGWLESPWA